MGLALRKAVIVVLFLALVSGVLAYGPITSLNKDFENSEQYNVTGKVYEISDVLLRRGAYLNISKGDLIRVKIGEYNYALFVEDVSEKKIYIKFPFKREMDFGVNQPLLADLNKDGSFDIEFNVSSISKGHAKVLIRKYREELLNPNGDYLELFDVKVRLAKKKIRSAKELEALITFENFGEGSSEIQIVYSITDIDKKKEYYKGMDTKVVQTEDKVVKDFDFLDLPPGKYILSTKIYYGRNQTGSSEEDFIVSDKKSQIFTLPFMFVSLIILMFVVILYFRLVAKRKEEE